MSCHCPLLPCLQVSWGPLMLRRNKEKIHAWGKKGDHGHPQERAHTGSFVLRVFHLFSEGGCFRGDFRGRSQQNIQQLPRDVLWCADASDWACRELGIILWSASRLSWICLVLIGVFLLFIPLTSSVLGFAWPYGTIWVSVLSLPDWGDLSCSLSRWGGEMWAISSSVSLVREDNILWFIIWL